MKNFDGFGLSSALMKSLAHMDYTKPTPIQEQAIPLALEGHDIMGTAQTGTGKTAAFAIPLVEHLMNNPDSAALVLTPTRELGKQIMDIMHQLLGRKSDINTAFIIGGEQMGKQLGQLKANPRLIVGTPGRINDHLQRGTMKLKNTDFLVLDETDRMLDMGFTVQLERIFKYMPHERQTLMFSATLPKNILHMSEKYMSQPKRVSVGEINVVATKIKQEVIKIEQDKKYDELLKQLYERSGSVIVFIKTKYGADRMANNLRRDGFTSEALHGDLRQNRRDKVMRNFREMNFRVLIATDIAARGLDVPHIEHVINYDLPQVAEDFIHRMGRTARAGAEGSAVSFVSNQDGRKWFAIERLLNPEAANDSRRERSEDGEGRGRRRRRPARRSRSGEARGAGAAEKKQEQKSSRANKPKGERDNKRDNKRGDSEQGKEFVKKFAKKPKRDGAKSGKPQGQDGKNRKPDAVRSSNPKKKFNNKKKAA